MAIAAEPKLSDRLSHLRDEAMARGGAWIADQNPFAPDVALWRSSGGGRSYVHQRADFLLELVRLARVEIRPIWRLAGEHLRCDADVHFGFQRPDHADRLDRLAEFGLTDSETDEVREAVRGWVSRGNWFDGKAPHVHIGPPDPEKLPGVNPRGWGASPTTAVIARGWIECHSIRDFAKVMRVGFGGIRDEVRALLAEADPTDPDLPEKENFWHAAEAVCDAGILLGRRYAELAEAMARDASDAEERERLEAMAATCRHVPERGARTFFEAVQAFWFAHILTAGEDGINANSIGRLDQILWPWYEADANAGRLTRDEALEIMEELACKLYLDYDVQAITLSGRDAEGNDRTNALTYVILDATERVDFIRDISVRLHPGSPPELVERCAELVIQGGGIPFFFNDDAFIPALSDRGIPESDACDYAPIGCVEITIPGKANPHAVSGWMSLIKCFEFALNDGRLPGSDEQIGPRTGTLASHATFADFLRAYETQVEHFVELLAYHTNRGELAQRERGPLPCWSVMTDACIPRGRDITNGGALYNYHSIGIIGTPNVADSLMAVKRLVFDEKKVDPDRLVEALARDFEGDEPLRQMLLNEAPKYGNDLAEVDELAAHVANHLIDRLDLLQSTLGGFFVAHLFSFLLNVRFGAETGATPDGRHAGEPLAYSLSAQQGRDAEGLTAMLGSLSCLPHHRAGGASAAIVEVDPKAVEGPDGAKRLAQTVRAAFAMGVGQLQWNVVTAERLQRAKSDPERYGNIPVRVAGYSQLFRLVDPDVQDHIIARTKHKK